MSENFGENNPTKSDDEITGSESALEPNLYQGLTDEQKKTLKNWVKRREQQAIDFATLTQKEKTALGIRPTETLAEKQARDEEENPSIPPTPQE